MTVLVTGGAGYIGSHTCLELLSGGYDVVVIDNFCNSCPESLTRVETITGRQMRLYEGDVRNESFLRHVFSENDIDSVIHFAGLKSVAESVCKPREYYDNNLNGLLVLTKVMEEANVKKLIFSSSATVYAGDNELPLRETARTGDCTNPYGWTKYMAEKILSGIADADKNWSIILLRYFNPIGAHESGLIGEDPRGIPNNLLPYICQVTVGRREKLTVFGGDYPTRDGTGVRDYIHVVDLAKGHVAALAYMQDYRGCEVFNLGTGTGYSVLEMVSTFEKVNQVSVPYVITSRRAGDLAACYADPEKAKRVLGWKAQRSLEDMCRDCWNWQRKNPMGYHPRSIRKPGDD